MIVVSDSSPLIALASVGCLDLLPKLYVRVLIPRAVYEEVVRDGDARAGAAELAAAAWMEVVEVDDDRSESAVGGHLGRGETQAIFLARTRRADLLIVDDHGARKRAEALGITVIGVAGVLLDAKQEGHIPAVRPLLDRILATVGFRLHRRLYDEVLRAAGES